MLVGNHSGRHRDRRRDGHRLVPARDGPAAARAGHGREVPEPHPLHEPLGVAHRASSPGLPEHAERLLEEDRLLMVFPEGARGTAKLFRERHSLVEFGTGFVRLALKTKTPIVPVRRPRRRRGLPHDRQRLQARAPAWRAVRAARGLRPARAAPGQDRDRVRRAARLPGHRQRGRRDRLRLRRQGEGGHRAGCSPRARGAVAASRRSSRRAP